MKITNKIKSSSNHNISRKLPAILAIIIIESIVLIALYLPYINVYSLTKANNQQSSEARKEYDKIEAKKLEPVYIELPGASKIQAIRENYTNPDSLWVLVNKSNPLPLDFAPKNLVIPNISIREDKSSAEKSVRKELATHLEEMFSDANKVANQLMLGSGYRSITQQTVYFNNMVSSVGYEQANKTIAVPSQSEHHTGLAVDISTVSRICYLAQCFEDTSDGKWLQEYSYKYGFILRYPKGKESITGYSYEPWHFRYVGIDLATALHESSLTLDEAWQYLNEALTTLKSNRAIQ